jgi:DNA-binding response OmpR family regulator
LSWRAIGGGAGGCAPLRVTAVVAELRPTALVLEVGAAEPTRRALTRAREAAGAPLPAALLLPARASWLRAPLPPELLPAAVLPTSDPPGVETVAGALSYDPASHELAGPAGEFVAHPLEAVLLDSLLARPGAVTPVEEVVRALWGEMATSDHHARAAIRTHVRTLQRKLATVGLAGALATLPRIGYGVDLEG